VVDNRGASSRITGSDIVVSAPPPPAAPSLLAASISGASVVLTWQDNSSNETAFYVERCEGAGCISFTGLGGSSANVPTFTDSSVTSGITYRYRVVAYNAGGYSSYSNIATIGGTGGSPASLAAPSNLVGQVLSRSQINLPWTNNNQKQVGVKIERCQGSNCTNFVQLAAVLGTATTYTNSGLAANTTYRYRVRAYNASGNSPYSNIARATTSKR
jgi:hypothetical protein